MAEEYDALQRLADYILTEIRIEFADKHLSNNLVNTIKVNALADNISIEIPAQVYNFYQYWQNRVIVPSKTRADASYASELDEAGSEFMVYTPEGNRFMAKPHNHVGWVDRVVDQAIQKWNAEMQAISKMEGKVTEI